MMSGTPSVLRDLELFSAETFSEIVACDPCQRSFTTLAGANDDLL